MCVAARGIAWHNARFRGDTVRGHVRAYTISFQTWAISNLADFKCRLAIAYIRSIYLTIDLI